MVVKLLLNTACVLCVAASGTAERPPTGLLRSLPRLCEGCLSEPLEQDYFGGVLGGEPPRLKSLTPEAFRQVAISGRAVIIENASAGTAMQGWTCEQLAKEFPKAKMRREYDWVKNPDDRNLQKMGDKKWAQTVEKGEEHQDRLSQDPKSPPFAPFYWGVRDHEKGDIGSMKVVNRIRQLISASVPRFMDANNADSMFNNAEFWLGANGTGARAHMDSHCISTLSVVLSGERRWRIGPVPRMPPGAGRSRQGEVVYDDGVAYMLGWKPMFEFTVKEGEAVLFPPGWIHETLNTAEGCTVALTTQFDMPRPSRYYRSYYNRLRRVGDLEPCWEDMKTWGSLGGKAPKKGSLQSTELRNLADEIYDRRGGKFTENEVGFFDQDGDGQVSRSEAVEAFTEWVMTERAIKKEKMVNEIQPDMSFQPSEAPKDVTKGSEL